MAKKYLTPSQVAAAVQRQGEGYARRVSSGVRMGIPAVLTAVVDDFVAEVKTKWPIGPNRRKRSGHSRDKFEVKLVQGDEKIAANVTNDARDEQGKPYVLFIRSRKNGLSQQKSAWNQLVVTPAKTDVSEEIAKQMVLLMQKTAKEAANG